MSLVDQNLPVGETGSNNNETQEQKKSYRDSLPGAPKPVCSRQSYDGALFDELYNDEMPSETKKTDQALQPPALPQKSALRASRMLSGFDLDLAAQSTVLGQTTPHDLYLSSEEDASSSADDFSDYDGESDSEKSVNDRRRQQQEDTARIVSVVFSGRPSIVEVSGRRSTSPSSNEARRQSSLGSLTESASTSSASSRRMSTSSTVASSIIHPPRSTSMGGDLTKNKPLFLNIDPFAHKSTPDSIDENETLKTPKTPTAVFKKTLNLVRKRSRPMLNTFVNGSQTGLSSPSTYTLSMDPLDNVHEEPKHQGEQTPVENQTPNKPAPPVTYNDIIKSAKKNAQSAPTTPLSPAPGSPMATERKGSRILSGLGMGRRRSIKVMGF